MATACVAPPALAKKAANGAEPVPSWSSQPDTFLGVPLGGDFPGDIPKCPFPSSSTAAPCYDTSGTDDGDYRIANTPQLSFPYMLTVTPIDGRIALITLHTGIWNFSQLKQTLLAKFGSPQTSATITVQTLAGVKYPSERLMWRGTTVDMEADERDKTTDGSAVVLVYRPIVREQTKANAKRAVGDAGKL